MPLTELEKSLKENGKKLLKSLKENGQIIAKPFGRNASKQCKSKGIGNYRLCDFYLKKIGLESKTKYFNFNFCVGLIGDECCNFNMNLKSLLFKFNFFKEIQKQNQDAILKRNSPIYGYPKDYICKKNKRYQEWCKLVVTVVNKNGTNEYFSLFLKMCPRTSMESEAQKILGHVSKKNQSYPKKSRVSFGDVLKVKMNEKFVMVIKNDSPLKQTEEPFINGIGFWWFDDVIENCKKGIGILQLNQEHEKNISFQFHVNNNELKDLESITVKLEFKKKNSNSEFYPLYVYPNRNNSVAMMQQISLNDNNHNMDNNWNDLNDAITDADFLPDREVDFLDAEIFSEIINTETNLNAVQNSNYYHSQPPMISVNNNYYNVDNNNNTTIIQDNFHVVPLINTEINNNMNNDMNDMKNNTNNNINDYTNDYSFNIPPPPPPPCLPTFSPLNNTNTMPQMDHYNTNLNNMGPGPFIPNHNYNNDNHNIHNTNNNPIPDHQQMLIDLQSIPDTMQWDNVSMISGITSTFVPNVHLPENNDNISFYRLPDCRNSTASYAPYHDSDYYRIRGYHPYYN